jgi:hypothetical protein
MTIDVMHKMQDLFELLYAHSLHRHECPTIATACLSLTGGYMSPGCFSLVWLGERQEAPIKACPAAPPPFLSVYSRAQMVHGLDLERQILEKHILERNLLERHILEWRYPRRDLS